MKKTGKKAYYSIILLILAVLTFFFQMGGGVGHCTAVSAMSENSSVIKDLSADKNFNFSDYPEKADDYSIKVIQIAESEKGYLYLYTYQPCQNTKKLVATDINMSLSKDVEGTQLYELIEVNSWGVFVKYLVRDIKVSNAATRYYNISSIYRVWDTAIDGETGTNNEGEKKAYEVSKVFKVLTVNGELKYTVDATQVIKIIEPYSDFLIYTTSASLPPISSIRLSFETHGYIDAHYIAFSTDLEIDSLKSATVTYTHCPATGNYNTFLGFDCGGDITYGCEKVDYAYPTYDSKADVSGSSWTGKKHKYTWDRIQTVAEFLSTEKHLTEETEQNLTGKQWVLRFLETKRTQKETGILGYKKYTTDFTKVNKVAVLRLEFETDGVCYNLGAVSDIVSGDEFPGNVEKVEKEKPWYEKLLDFFKKIINFFKNLSWKQILLICLAGILLAGVVVAIVIFGIKKVFQLIWWLIKKVLHGIWWLFCLPFRGLKKLFSKKEESAREK